MDSFAQKLLLSGDTNISNYLLDHFTELGMTPAELVVYLQIKRASDHKDNFPSANSIAQATSYSPQQIYNIFHELIQKHLMTIKTVQNHQGQDCDSYDFQLMYEKLAHLAQQDHNEPTESTVEGSKNNGAVTATVNERQNVFQKIETEFGRGLSPIELETVSQWLDTDHYTPELILLALREAVLNQVYSLKYIDKILINWRKRNVKTSADVDRELQKREHKRYSYQNGVHHKTDGPEIPLFKIK